MKKQKAKIKLLPPVGRAITIELSGRACIWIERQGKTHTNGLAISEFAELLSRPFHTIPDGVRAELFAVAVRHGYKALIPRQSQLWQGIE